MKRNNGNLGFTLIELLVVISIIALLLSILLPSLSRAREISKRVVCATNLKGIGTACKLYAAENAGSWMVPAFNADAVDQAGIRYLGEICDVNSLLRRRQSTTGSTRLSVTRAYWMLVRSGSVTVRQFVCPSSGDEPDPTGSLEIYYDFADLQHISYGFQVPFGPSDTRARDRADQKMVLTADRGPFGCEPTENTNWNVGVNGIITLLDPPGRWRSFNSPNHGGARRGVGQNCLFGDGHVTFERTPAVGVDHDNIYTLMLNIWTGSPENTGRIHGANPGEAPTRGDPYPGQDALGQGKGMHTSTDSLIYP